MVISSDESMLLQSLATASLLAELSNSDFLNSTYFKTMPFSDDLARDVLVKSGLGNPATMQMMLYSLAVVPKKILSRCSDDYLLSYVTGTLNPLIASLVEKNGTYSTYSGEDSIDTINYFQHIADAVENSTCHFIDVKGINYVVFKNSMNGLWKSSIRIECSRVGIILMECMRMIRRYFSKRMHNP